VSASAAGGDEPLDDGDDVIGGAMPAHVHGQGFAGVLVDDVAQLQPPAVGGLVELEVDGPHLVRPPGSQQRPAAGRARLRMQAGGRRSPRPATTGRVRLRLMV
jgi:hypothetical protein